MTIAEIETALAARIADKLPALAAEEFPERPDDYRFSHNLGVALVRYSGTTFHEVRDIGVIFQESQVEFEIVLIMKRLRGGSGLYNYLDAVRLALTGYRIPGTAKFWPVKTADPIQEQGIWQCSTTFATIIPAVEVPDDEVLPLLKQLTTSDNFGDVTTIP